MIINNAQIMFIVQREYSCSSDFPWFTKNLMVNDSVFGLHLMKIKTCRTGFTVYLISAFIFSSK